jgi:phenylalanyl-tRNA synthetase beta chain
MTNVIFPRKEIEKHIKLTKGNIDKISLFGTPLESINDKEIEIEVFPNRPDLISFQGFIRGFKAFLGKETGLKKYKLNKPEENYTVKISPSVKSVRPYTVCSIVKNLKFNDENIKQIIDLQEKLHNTIGRNRKKAAIGIYPLEKITLPIKYEARDPKQIKFIPLEAGREMTASQILQRHPAGKEFGHLLEGFNKYPVFLDGKNKVLSVPPLINSEDTGRVTTSTKEVFIECSGHHLPTLEKTLNIIITTFADMGGKVYQMNLEYSNKKLVTPDLTPEKIKVSLENTNKLLGLDLKESDLSKLLPKMGMEYTRGEAALIPAWRSDILHEVDIIEDIAIAYGYDKLIPEIPNVSTIAQESKESKMKSKISKLLLGLGLIETMSYHLIKTHEADLMKLQEKIELEDSKTDYKLLRPNLLIPALRILSENKDHDYPQETFEIGKTFSLNPSSETGIKETEKLIIVSSPSNFTKMKQILDYLGSSLNLKLKVEDFSHKNLIEGRTASILLENKKIGYLGEVHPETLRSWSIKMPLAVLEISLQEIFEKL